MAQTKRADGRTPSVLERAFPTRQRAHSTEGGRNPLFDTFLKPGELAARWRISVKKLENDRWRGEGVPFVRIGSAVRYRLCDVLAFEEARLVTSTSVPGRRGRHDEG